MNFSQKKELKDQEIKFRCTKNQKLIITYRAKELKMKTSEYLLSLVEKDLNRCR